MARGRRGGAAAAQGQDGTQAVAAPEAAAPDAAPDAAAPAAAAPAATPPPSAAAPPRPPARRSGSGPHPVRLPAPRSSGEALSPAERRSRCSAEFVVNLGPPEPLSSLASSDLDAAVAAAARVARGAGHGGAGAQGSSPKARPDLLASIEEEAQLTLRYHRISAFVATRVGPPGLRDRLRGAARSIKGGPRDPEERQILFSVSGEIMPGEVLALM
jgi:hypothetical protein